MKIEIASVAEIDRLWPLVAPMLQKSCERAPQPICAGELWQMCRSGFAFLFVVHDGARIASASVLQFENGNTLRVWAMGGGGIKDWFGDYYGFVRLKALEGGATRLVANGRRGWLRMCPGSTFNGDEYEVLL